MRCTIFFAACLMASAVTAGAGAQTSKSVWDGVYTDAQAERGATPYMQNCVMCHGPTLAGNGEAPPLVGRFIPDWDGTSLDMLFDKIRTTMPLNRPGALSPTVNADILAFILKQNSFPAGPVALNPGDDLKAIGFNALKPSPLPPAATSSKQKTNARKLVREKH